MLKKSSMHLQMYNIILLIILSTHFTNSEMEEEFFIWMLAIAYNIIISIMFHVGKHYGMIKMCRYFFCLKLFYNNCIVILSIQLALLSIVSK